LPASAGEPSAVRNAAAVAIRGWPDRSRQPIPVFTGCVPAKNVTDQAQALIFPGRTGRSLGLVVVAAAVAEIFFDFLVR
jgi:hypothetical protein